MSTNNKFLWTDYNVSNKIDYMEQRNKQLQFFEDNSMSCYIERCATEKIFCEGIYIPPPFHHGIYKIYHKQSAKYNAQDIPKLIQEKYLEKKEIINAESNRHIKKNN